MQGVISWRFVLTPKYERSTIDPFKNPASGDLHRNFDQRVILSVLILNLRFHDPHTPGLGSGFSDRLQNAEGKAGNDRRLPADEPNPYLSNRNRFCGGGIESAKTLHARFSDVGEGAGGRLIAVFCRRLIRRST